MFFSDLRGRARMASRPAHLGWGRFDLGSFCFRAKTSRANWRRVTRRDSARPRLGRVRLDNAAARASGGRVAGGARGGGRSAGASGSAWRQGKLPGVVKPAGREVEVLRDDPEVLQKGRHDQGSKIARSRIACGSQIKSAARRRPSRWFGQIAEKSPTSQGLDRVAMDQGDVGDRAEDQHPPASSEARWGRPRGWWPGGV